MSANTETLLLVAYGYWLILIADWLAFHLYQDDD